MTNNTEQEPVAWIDLTKEELHQIEMTCETSTECYRVIAKALKDRNYAAPSRTKDLTDDELNKLLDYWSEDERSAYGGAWSADGEYVDMKSFARAVIAADREKNK